MLAELLRLQMKVNPYVHYPAAFLAGGGVSGADLGYAEVAKGGYLSTLKFSVARSTYLRRRREDSRPNMALH